MHILPVMVIEELPNIPTDYVPSKWALSVAWQLEKLHHDRVPAVLVHLEDVPRYRHVGAAKRA